MTNFLNSLPSEIITHITNFTDSKTKRDLSMVDVRINAVIFNQTKSLAIFPPSPFSPYKLSEIPDNILVNTIQRCPNLKKLIFCKNSNKEFTAHEIPYIENLILHLQINTKGLLGSIKKITCQEFRKDLIGGFDEARARKLNNLFLSTMSHKGLEKIKIKGDRKESLLTGTEIHSILVNSPHLTTFIFDVFDTKRKNMAFSFAESPNLRKVKLLQWKGPISTLESLRSCKKLKELVLDYKGYYDDDIIKVVLSIDNFWNLKRLELKGVSLTSDNELDAITKKIPNLECLSLHSRNISDNGMGRLGENCPHLKILKFTNLVLTNIGLDNLTKYLPDLELIYLNAAYEITEEGIAAIARNCTKLQFIEVNSHKHVEKSGIDALIQHCPLLKVVGFSHGGSVSLEGMSELVEQRPELIYVELYGLHNIEEKQTHDFYLKYPNICSEIPYTSNAKQMHKLTI